MRGERLRQTIALCFRFSSAKRMEYLKSHHVFASVGEKSTFMGRVVPLYPNLIKIGSNVRISSKVSFICHDTIHKMLNNHPTYGQAAGFSYPEKICCIEIGDNVFIGAGTTILYDVKIGSNVIIGTGSLINKDVPDNCVVAGVPARVIGSFDDLCNKRMNEPRIPEGMKIQTERVCPELERFFWERFAEAHQQVKQGSGE